MPIGASYGGSISRRTETRPSFERRSILLTRYYGGRMPQWLKRAINALGFATFLAVEMFGLWGSRPNLPRSIFTSVYLMVVALVGVAIDRGLARK